MINIELSWPSEDLSPNARLHFHPKAQAFKKAKDEAWGVTKAVMGALNIRPGTMSGPIVASIVFHPAIDRTRDLDNFQARMKASLDGIALALGINDSLFRPVSSIGAKRKPSCVVVHLTPALVDAPVVGVVS